MTGIVTNMMDAACSTSGVLVTAAASERAVVYDSMAEDTIWDRRYCAIFRAFD